MSGAFAYTNNQGKTCIGNFVLQRLISWRSAVAFETIRVKRSRRRYRQIQAMTHYIVEKRTKAQREAAKEYASRLAIVTVVKIVMGADLTEEERAADLSHFVYRDPDAHNYVHRALKYLTPAFSEELKTITVGHPLLVNDELDRWIWRRFELVKQLEDGVTNYAAPWSATAAEYGFDPIHIANTTNRDTRAWQLRKNLPPEEHAREVHQSRSRWERFMRWMAGKNYR
jgi:hypothetical protein